MMERPILFSAPMVRAIPTQFREWNDSRKIVLDNSRVKNLFESGMTALEISKEMGCSTYPVKRSLKQLGLSRPAKRRSGMGSGPNNPSWKGGRRIRSDGYVVLWTPSGERLEHQVAMEDFIGRPLTQREVVHHRDGNKQNNSIENLELTSQSSHARHHALQMHSARSSK